MELRNKHNVSILGAGFSQHAGLPLISDFLYADARPHCHHEVEHNTTILTSDPVNKPQEEKAWPIRLFLRAVRFVES